MGVSSSKSPSLTRPSAEACTFKTILDQYETIDEVQAGLRKSGLESSQLIVGIDFTKSNEWCGQHSFLGKSLHSVDAQIPNPYEQGMSIIARTLAAFDDDDLIPCYGFGDHSTTDRFVFSFFPHDRPANGLAGAVMRYKQIAPLVKLSGPTSFAPLVRQAARLVVNSGMQYHILVILADGQVTPSCRADTIDALVKASRLPLSIIMVGVGDGPWDEMKSFDDQLPARKFDNFQFVNFYQAMREASVYGDNYEKVEAHFAVRALMEIPEQYSIIQRLGLLNPQARNVRIDNSRKLVLPPPSNVLVADHFGDDPTAPTLIARK